MDVHTVLHQFAENLDWNYLRVIADEFGDDNNIDARFCRWLADAGLVPYAMRLGKDAVQYRWYPQELDGEIYGNKSALPIQCKLPKALYDALTIPFFQFVGVDTRYTAYWCIYQTYLKHRMISTPPRRSPKCPYCGLVQDLKPPTVFVENVHECWHCERYFQCHKIGSDGIENQCERV